MVIVPKEWNLEVKDIGALLTFIKAKDVALSVVEDHGPKRVEACGHLVSNQTSARQSLGNNNRKSIM